MDKQLFNQPLTTLAQPTAAGIDATARVAFANSTEPGGHNILVYGLRSLFARQDNVALSGSQPTPGVNAATYNYTGTELRLVDTTGRIAGDYVHIMAATAGVVVLHNFDKASIPVGDRPANYDSLAPIYTAIGSTYTTGRALEPITLRLMWQGGVLVWVDWARHTGSVGGWLSMPTVAYEAEPTTSARITTYTSQVAELVVGDVLKVKLVGLPPQYNVIVGVDANGIDISGVALDADIETIQYERGNRARLQSVGLEVDDEEVQSFAFGRPDRSETAGGTPVSGGVYGANILGWMRKELPQGSFLVKARATLNDCGSSATALEVGIGFGGQAHACTIVCSGLDNTASIDRLYYQVPEANLLDAVDIVVNAGNRDTARLFLHMLFFIDISI